MNDTIIKYHKINQKNIIKNINDNRIFIIILIVFIFISLSFQKFISLNNFTNICLNVSVIGILSCAVLMLIISGHFDLSVGSILALTGIISAKLDLNGIPLPYIFIIMVLIGSFIGILNGIVVKIFNVNSLIATLSMSFIIRGFILIYSEEKTISGLSNNYLSLATRHLGPIPFLFIYLILIAIISYIILQKTIFGKHIYIIGSNSQAAYLHGINVNLHVIFLYIYVGAISGICGILYSSKYAGASPIAARGIEIAVIAAIIIGGANLYGGTGTILRTLGGVLILEIIRNGLELSNMNSNFVLIFEGFLIILAVTYEFLLKNFLYKRLSR